MSPARSVWLGAAAFTAVYFAAGFQRYVTYTSGADLALFTQSIATVFAGFHNTTENASHFAVHFSPVLYLCAPLLLATHSPLALVAIQSATCALAVPPLYYLACKRLPDGLAAGAAMVGYVYAPLSGVAFSDFHENGFAPAAATWLLWAIDARRWGWACAFVAFALSIKEDQALLVGCVGLAAVVYFARRGERAGTVFGIGTVLVAAVVFVGYFTLVRSLAGSPGAWSPTHFYDWSTPAHDGPKGFMNVVARASYVAEALTPLLFVPLLSPVFLLAMPGFVEDLASKEAITFTMGTHYAAVWIGFVLVAFVLGLARIARRRDVARARLVVRLCAVVCVVNVVFASPAHYAHFLRARTAHDAELDAVIARVVPDADLGTQDELFTHLGFDPHASLGLTRDPQCLLVDRTSTSVFWIGRDRPALDAALAHGTYRLARSYGDLDLYVRPGSEAGACLRGAV